MGLVIVWLLLLGLWLSPAVACDERVWYLDAAGGSDSHDCHTPDTACKSLTRLQEILTQAKPGEVIRLKRGSTWQPTARIDLKTSGIEAAPIILEAYGEGPLPILDGQQLPGGTMILQCKRLSWYIVRDVQFQAGKGAFMALGCTDLVFDRVQVRVRCDQECVHLKYDGPDYPSQRIVWQNGIIDPPSRTEAIYIGTDPGSDGGKPDLTRDITITNTVIVGAASGQEAIEMKSGTSHVVIVGNRLANNSGGSNGMIFSARGQHDRPPGNHRIEGNTLYNVSGDQGYAIRLRNDGVVRGNVIHTTSRAGILLEQPSDHPVYQRTVEYNTVLYATEAGIVAQGSGTTVQHNLVWQSGGGNEAQDPGFVNMAQGDLRLRAGSPATLRGAFPTPAPQ